MKCWKQRQKAVMNSSIGRVDIVAGASITILLWDIWCDVTQLVLQLFESMCVSVVGIALRGSNRSDLWKTNLVKPSYICIPESMWMINRMRILSRFS